MCGIVGYTGSRPCREILLAGLEKLEYRGYDSAGISLLTDGEVETVRAVGNLSKLREAVGDNGFGNGAVAGIGHTRWATHGRVTEANAHPHDDNSGRVHVVLNGIVENWTELRQGLEADGATFSSETDAEAVAHLIAARYDGDLVAAVRSAYGELRGHYAFVAVHADEPSTLVAARKECPLVVGVGEGESFVASAIPAFLRDTRRVQLVENDEIVTITPEGASFTTAAGAPVERAAEEVDWDEEAAEKGGYETFMLKEIHEQPDAVAETVADRLIGDGVELGDIGISDDELRNLRRIVIVACGTSYHAGLSGRYAVETWSRVPVEMDVASEFRYRDPVVDERDLVIGITQSGETADTLAAMRLAREKGARVLAITNVMGSQATRDSDGVLFTRAGLEIGVAATKTYVSQVAAMLLLALRLGQVRETLPPERIAELVADLRALPRRIDELLEQVDEPVRKMAEHWRDAGFFLYLGRHAGLATALEGALKLKEISYIHAEGYPAGEMKHGPNALIDESLPVVVIATRDPLDDESKLRYEKTLSNIQEVKARSGIVVAVCCPEDEEEIRKVADHVLTVPSTNELLLPILEIVPLQLLAYHIAVRRGCDVDQPRNLAKSVTVE